MPATLYTFAGSVWAAAAELAVAELGYPAGAVKAKAVNLVEGHNFEPSFLDVNPAGTLPTLAVDGHVYKNTTDVVRYLASHAPSPLPEPTTAQKELISLVHEDRFDPNFALLLVRSPEELTAKAGAIPKAFVEGRQATLDRLVADPAAAKYLDFYKAKSEGNGFLVSIYQGSTPPEQFFSVGQAHYENLRSMLYEILPKQLQPENGEADFHVVAWLTRIAATSGGTGAADAASAIEKAFGTPLDAGVKAYFEKWIAKDSWKTVYSAVGLH